MSEQDVQPTPPAPTIEESSTEEAGTQATQEGTQEAEASKPVESEGVRIRRQRDDYRSRSEKLQEQLDAAKALLEERKENTAPAPPVAAPQGDDRIAKLELKTDGYSSDEADTILAHAKARGIPVSEAIKDDFIQAGISGMREKSRIASATPTPSSRTAAIVVGDKSPSEMSTEEFKTNLPAMRKQIADKRSGRGSNSRT